MSWFDDDMRQRDREDFEDGPPGIWRWPEVTPWGTENAEYRIQSESLSANGGESDRALWLQNNGTEEDEFDDSLWMDCEPGEDPFE